MDEHLNSDETCSYSEDDTEVEERNRENVTAANNIQRILAEHEISEQQALPEKEFDVHSENENIINDAKKANGKGKMPKWPVPNEKDMFSMFNFLHAEIERLKQQKPESSSDDEDHTDFKARVVASTRSAGSVRAAEQCCSKTLTSSSTSQSKVSAKEAVNAEQLRSANKSQLSSVKTKQLSPAKKRQLSSAPKENPGQVKLKKVKFAKNKNALGASTPLFSDTDINTTVTHTPAMENPDVVQIHLDESDRDLGEQEDDLPQHEDDDEAIEENDDDFQDLVDAVDVMNEDEQEGVPLVDTWAVKVNLAWKAKVSKSNMMSIQGRYLIPSNLTDFKVPKMNQELWRMIGKWQKKSDLAMSHSQKLLIKSVSAVLTLNSLCETLDRTSRIAAMRTAIDIVTMLGKVNTDIAQKRKVAVRPCLKGDFKTLSSSTKVTDQLFGDNLTQDIKDVQVKRKIEDGQRTNYGNSYKRFRGNSSRGYNNYNNNNNTNNGSFLWRGQGRSRPPRYYRSQSPHQGYHQKKQNGQ